MVAYEPGYLFQGVQQVMIDMPGHPGMSGSPVYTLSTAFTVTTEQKAAFEKALISPIESLQFINSIEPNQLADETVGVTFIGVYAGATGKTDLERLALGRMFGARIVRLLIENGEIGKNPFCPDLRD